MSLSEELRDPWGLLVAGVSGGMAWALLGSTAVALPVGLAVGAGILGVKAVSGMLLDRDDDRAPAARPVARPAPGTPAAGWLRRAEAAVRALDDLAGSAGTGVLASSVRTAPPGVHQEVARSAAALADRIAVRNRLRDARDTVLARMQAVALGLEGLVARLAEVLALAETTGGLEDTAGEVAGLAAELEGLRAGLTETEALSRGALAAGPFSPGPLPPGQFPPG